MFSRWPSVCVRPSVVRPSVRPSVRTSFPFDNLSVYKRISFRFYICHCTNNVSLGIVSGYISIIYNRATALVNIQKWFLDSSSFIIRSSIMKLHKNDQSNKSSILAEKFCHPRLSALALGLYTCIKS